MTANRLRGEVEFTAADRLVKLVFDANAMCLAETQLGLPTDRIIDQVNDHLDDKTGGSMTMVTLRALLWAAAQRHQPDVTVHQAGDIISDLGIDQATIHVLAGLSLAFGTARKDGNAQGDVPLDQASGAGTGSLSTSDGAKPAKPRRRSGKRPRG